MISEEFLKDYKLVYSEELLHRRGFRKQFEVCAGALIIRDATDIRVFMPEPKEWNGEGLPPVGTVCEALMPPRGICKADSPWIWRTVEVVKIGFPGSESECLVFDVENSAPAWLDQFRPIRTPEQIAEEERSNTINEIIKLWKVPPVGSQYNAAYEMAAAVYDARFRKQADHE